MYFSVFGKLCVSRVSNFQIPNMIQRLNSSTKQVHIHIYSIRWIGYGFTEGLKIGRDISGRGKAGEPQGKNIPWKLSRWGQFLKPRGSWGYSGQGDGSPYQFNVYIPWFRLLILASDFFLRSTIRLYLAVKKFSWRYSQLLYIFLACLLVVMNERPMKFRENKRSLQTVIHIF